jgi:putative nucleotidyltransferase with HDIG domain
MPDQPDRILIVDDDPDVRQTCREFLQAKGYDVFDAPNGLKAEALLGSRSFSLIISDIVMPSTGGIELLGYVRENHPDTQVILFTGHASIDLAKEAIRNGAFDFITKPFGMQDLLKTVDRALEGRRRLTSELPHRALQDLRNMTATIDVSAEGIPEFLRRFSSSVRKSFRANAVRVYLSDREEPDSLVLMQSSGSDEMMGEEVWQKATEEAWEGEEGMFLSTGDGPASASGGEENKVMCASLTGGNQRIGVCACARLQTPDPFTPRDLKVLSLFSAQAGNQLMNYRLADSLRRNTSELRTINRVVSRFSGTLDSETILNALGEGFRLLMDYDLFGVIVVERSSSPLAYFRLRSDLPDSVFLYGPLRDRIERELSQAVLDESLQVRIVTTFKADGGIDPSRLAGIRMVQLAEHGQLEGVMIFARWYPGRDEDLDSTFMPILARQGIGALSNARFHERGEQNYIQTIGALASAVDAKDPYTHNHSRNVTAYSLVISDYVGLGESDRNDVRNAAMLHDIGKIGVPDSILNKPGSLTEKEFGIMKEHPELGYRILKPVRAFANLIDAVRHHHEHYDGSGYPMGLRGEDIPYKARILCVSDAFDSMYSDRVYRPSPGLDYAKEELRNNAGTQFDPSLAYAFLEVLAERTPEQILSSYHPELGQ